MEKSVKSGGDWGQEMMTLYCGRKRWFRLCRHHIGENRRCMEMIGKINVKCCRGNNVDVKGLETCYETKELVK
jgi:hypothetical protein